VLFNGQIKKSGMAEEKVFADGFIFKRREGAPEWVVGGISVKVDEAVAFLSQHQKNGWVNIDVKRSKGGSYYMELDTYVPKSKDATQSQSTGDMPF
jgi:hypothetical protein